MEEGPKGKPFTTDPKNNTYHERYNNRKADLFEKVARDEDLVRPAFFISRNICGDDDIAGVEFYYGTWLHGHRESALSTDEFIRMCCLLFC